MILLQITSAYDLEKQLYTSQADYFTSFEIFSVCHFKHLSYYIELQLEALEANNLDVDTIFFKFSFHFWKPRYILTNIKSSLDTRLPSTEVVQHIRENLANKQSKHTMNLIACIIEMIISIESDSWKPYTIPMRLLYPFVKCTNIVMP